MTGPNLKALVERVRSASLLRVLGVYVIASSAVLQAIDLLESQFGLPSWFFPAGLALLLIGLPIITSTAVIQSSVTAKDCPDDSVLVPGTDASGASASGGLRRLLTWRFAILGSVLAFIVLGSIGMTVVLVRNSGRDLNDDAVAVMPFHVVGDGTELWREGMVDLLTAALNATGEFRSSDPRTVLNRWGQAASDPNELPEPEKAAEVAGALGASRVILGSLIRIPPNGVRLSADLYSVRWRRKEASAVVEGREDEITTLVDRLTVDLLKSVWEGDAIPEFRVSAMTTASIPALRSYLEGEQAFRRSQFTEAQTAFTRAIEHDSTFAIAHYRLAQTYGWFQGLGASEVPRYLVAAERHSAGLSQRDSLLIGGWKLADVDGDLDAIPLFQSLAARYSDDLEVWHGLGDAIFHMGAQIGLPLTAAIEPLERTLALDSTFAPALIHLIEIAYLESDTARGRLWADRYLAMDSTSLYGRSFSLLTPLQFGPPDDSARAAAALDTANAELLHWMTARLRSSGRNLSVYEMVTLAMADPRFGDEDRAMGLWHLGVAHLRHGHVALAVELFLQVNALAGDYMVEPIVFMLANARELGITVDPDSQELLEQLSAELDWPVTSLAVAAARQGRAEEAEAAIARLEAKADSLTAAGRTERGRSVRGQAWTLRGRIAATRDSVDTAIAHLQRGLAMINATWSRVRDLDRYWLAHLLEERGSTEEALRIYGSLYWNPWVEPLGFLHRAQLHERRGEPTEAARYYARFLELWSDADPHLQPRVEAARLALQRLHGETTTS
jgi:tetratricopeptide (TPR) repeat protein